MQIIPLLVFQSQTDNAHILQLMQGTIGQYFGTMHCPICKALTVDSICTNCRADPQKVAVSLNVRIQAAEKENSSIVQVHLRNLVNL